MCSQVVMIDIDIHQTYLQITRMLPDDEIIAAAHATHPSEANLEVLSPSVRNWRKSSAVTAWPWAWEHSQHESNGPDCA